MLSPIVVVLDTDIGRGCDHDHNDEDRKACPTDSVHPDRQRDSFEQSAVGVRAGAGDDLFLCEEDVLEDLEEVSHDVFSFLM